MHTATASVRSAVCSAIPVHRDHRSNHPEHPLAVEAHSAHFGRGRTHPRVGDRSLSNVRRSSGEAGQPRPRRRVKQFGRNHQVTPVQAYCLAHGLRGIDSVIGRSDHG